MRLSILFSLAALVFIGCTNALSTNVLLPLYVYPSPGAWETVFTAIKNNPSLTFQVVINPNSGPGSLTPGYDNNWISAVSTLNSYRNAQVLGYVHTSWGDESAQAVYNNISIWQTWNAFSTSNIAVDGIFFDEVLDGQAAYLTTLTNYARAKLGKSIKVVFNAGQKISDTTYFALADQVVVFEKQASFCESSGPYPSREPRPLTNSTSDDATVLATNVPAKYASKASVLVFDFAAIKGTSATLKTWISAMAKAGVGSLNIVDSDWSGTNLDGTADIANVARLLVSAQTKG